MTTFLGASWVDPANMKLHWSLSPLDALAHQGGRVSPIHCIAGTCPDDLPSSGFLVFVFPRDVRHCLYTAQSLISSSDGATLFMSHGLASCVVLSERDPSSMIDELHALDVDIAAVEVWPFEDAQVRFADIRLERLSRPPVSPLVSLATEVDGPIGVEVRQFEANLAMLQSTSDEFAPEFRALCEWLAESVSSHVSRIAAELAAPDGLEATKRLHHDVSLLVDVNSCLAMVLSQLSDVLPPLSSASYPVGEHSLLGIGGVARGIWRIYEHMAKVFAEADLPNRLESAFGASGFDPGFNAPDHDRASWERARLAFLGSSKPPGVIPEVRQHLVYFSSRWGFHETVNSISVSWQTIESGATAQWNLLTLSHEFLHSHFRELIRANVLGATTDGERSALVALYNTSREHLEYPATLKESLQVFLLRQLRAVERGGVEARALASATSVTEFEDAPLTTEELLQLVAAPLLDHLEEVVVHIMDYHYFYEADDEAYVSSLWHSWTLVPQVHRKLRHYLLRTLFALSSVEVPTGRSAEAAFRSSYQRLARVLIDLKNASGGPLVEAAVDELASAEAKRELWARFRASYLNVEFTRTVLIDDAVYARLTTDDQVVPGEPPQYRLIVGEFPEARIESPTGFILDRYRMIGATLATETEAASLWQLLVLV